MSKAVCKISSIKKPIFEAIKTQMYEKEHIKVKIHSKFTFTSFLNGKFNKFSLFLSGLL